MPFQLPEKKKVRREEKEKENQKKKKGRRKIEREKGRERKGEKELIQKKDHSEVFESKKLSDPTHQKSGLLSLNIPKFDSIVCDIEKEERASQKSGFVGVGKQVYLLKI